MATSVASGRVSTRTKERVDAILARAGKTPGDVIKDVWANIAQTGELPATQSREDEFEHRRQAFSAFREFVRSAPQAPDWFVRLTDEETGDVVAEELLAKDEGGQPCADS